MSAIRSASCARNLFPIQRNQIAKIDNPAEADIVHSGDPIRDKRPEG